MPPTAVLSTVDGEAYARLSTTAAPRADRYALGKGLRDDVPRRSLGEWDPQRRWLGPVESVIATNAGRAKRLIPIRVGRMLASPFAFLRGAAALNATDFSTLPETGIHPVICGDAHLGNFGFYASPERDLAFDLNDFDEAHPGPWEWDLRRLVASVHVAGRENGATEEQCSAAVEDCVESYRRYLGLLAERPLLDRTYHVIGAGELEEWAPHKGSRKAVARAAEKARRRTSDRALPRLTEGEGADRRIVTDPPLVVRPNEARRERLVAALDAYLGTLPLHWARVVGGYRVLDVAHKVVGVGSVGLRAYIVLCEGSSPDDVLFLQLKQARRSVVAPLVHGDSAWHLHQGQRVVEYQQALQTVSDPLLGWTSVDDTQFYVRQYRDMKGAIEIEGIDADTLADYAAFCGLLLAKGHARTSGASMLTGYLGGGGKVRKALVRFARDYADQTERDHAALAKAVERGVLSAEHGV